jgi:hypothetical protein
MSSRQNKHLISQLGQVLADQFFGDLRRRAAAEGEHHLLVAVLEDATNCFQKNALAEDKRGRALFEEAEEWLMEENTGAPFCFREVCETLGLNPIRIRAGLRAWQAREAHKAASGNLSDQVEGPTGPETPPTNPEPLKKVSGGS